MIEALQWIVFIGACVLARWIYDRWQRRERRHTPRTRALLEITEPTFTPIEEVRLMPGNEADVAPEGGVAPDAIRMHWARRKPSPVSDVRCWDPRDIRLWQEVHRELQP